MTDYNRLSDDLIGALVDEYRIEESLGSGGMSRVYRAVDTKLQRNIALKVVAPNFRAQADYKRRFEQEAQSVARLEHPNIVNIYRYGEFNGLYYMAMRYLEGLDLAKVIDGYRQRGETMPLDDVLSIVRQLGSALDYAHSKNVIHRDVKPGNTIITPDGTAVLTDFGLALMGDTGTQGEVFGSPSYISPEQAISSAKAVPQSDLYSLGIMLFEMLTNKVPFTGSNPTDIATKHITDWPPTPSTLNANISPDVDQVVLRCLEKRPESRYRTGADLSAALQSAIHASRGWRAPTGVAAQMPSSLHLATMIHRLSSAAPDAPMMPPSYLKPPEMPNTGQIARVSGTSQSTVPAEESPAAQGNVPHQGNVAEPPYSGSVTVTRPAGVHMPTWINPSAKADAGSTKRSTETGPKVAAPSTTDYGTPPQQPDYAIPPSARSGSDWRVPLAVAAGVFILGLCLLIGLFSLLNNNGVERQPTTVANRPTATTMSLPASNTPSALQPTPTNISLVPTFVVTQNVPTPFIFSTPFVQPPPIQPTQAPAAVNAPPPADRNNAPANAQRLGEFTVEQYCNRQGLGIVETNNRSDWACTNANGSIAYILQPSDFDTICRERYGQPYAFAVRDQRKDIPNYNWSCYLWTSYPTSGGSGVSSGGSFIITPSVATLRPVQGPGWIAFVNIGGAPMTLDNFKLERDGNLITAAYWGLTSLNAGECLRIYGGQVPTVQPDGCSRVIDILVSDDQKLYWLQGTVNVTVSPDLQFSYTAQ